MYLNSKITLVIILLYQCLTIYCDTRSKAKHQGSSKSDSTHDVIEQIVCKENDIPNNGMREFEVGNSGYKVLLVRQKNKLFAVGAKCSHYGAPLAKGVLGDGVVRCPWHGATFNLKNGNVEDSPGFDNIPSFKVSVSNGNVKVSANKHELENSKSVIPLTKRNPNDNRTFIVIGSGPAGAYCVERLRIEGYDGRLLLITKDNHLPYDRTKLSKVLNSDIYTLSLRSQFYYDTADIETLTNTSVKSIDTKKKMIILSKNKTIPFNALFIASGMRPYPIHFVCEYENVFPLYSFDDAHKIYQSLSPDKELVVIGSSFIGMEVAAAVVSKVKSVHVISKNVVPFEESFGKELGQHLQELFESKGVVFHLNTKVRNYMSYDNILTKVRLVDELVLKTDICISAIGSKTNIEFLAGSNITLNNSTSRHTIEVNENLETNIKGIFAGGDVANAPVYPTNVKASLGHWQIATYHGKIAALQMLGKKTPIKSVPFFWTSFFGTSIRFAGFNRNYTDVLITGDLKKSKAVLYYCKENNVVAVATIGSDPIAAQFAELLRSGRTLHKDQAIDNKWLTKEEDTIMFNP